MTDFLISLMAILVLFCAVALAMAGGIRLQKWREIRHARRMQARQWVEVMKRQQR